MSNTDAYALQRSDLNGFLFADVGVEASGMTLSVLSTLARVGVDPWQEAGRLAKLPRTAAIEGLARIIAAMPASLWSLADATPIAARLVALLPTRGSVSVIPSPLPANAATIAARLTALLPARGGSSARPAPGTSRMTGQLAIVLVLLGAVLVGLTLNLTGQLGATSDSNAGVSTSRPALPAMPLVGHVPTTESPQG